MDNKLLYGLIDGKLNGDYLQSIIHETDIYNTDHLGFNAYYTHV